MTKNTTCCFTGYRPEKMPFKGDESTDDIRKLKADLHASINNHIEAGCIHFISGGSRGFDMWAAEYIAMLKQSCSDITLEIAVPHPGQADKWSSDYRFRYDCMLSAADAVTVLCPGYSPNCFHVRNRYMIENSSYLIAYYDGQPGGTSYTVSYAKKRGLQIDNLCDDQLCFFLNND